MKPLKIAIIAGSLSLLAWSQGMPQGSAPAQPSQAPAAQTGQQPAAQPGGTQQAAAPSTSSTISGCMQESWGHFLISEGSTTYDVRGVGTNLYDHANHTVQVKGLPDTKAAQNNQVPFYVQQVQDSGQTCGPNANATAQNAAQPGPGAAAGQAASGMTSGQASTGATQQQTPGSMGTPASGTQPDQNAPSATPQTSTPQTSPQTSAPQSSATPEQNRTTPQGSMSSNSQTTTSSQAQTSTTGSSASSSSGTAQPGSSPEAAAGSQQTGAQSGGVEEKAPSAGTPSSVGAPASSSSPNSEASSQSSASQQNLSTFNGCLSGSANSYKFTADGKDYSLQGNTSSLSGLSGHKVEVTGEVFNGKAIQVNGARDLGSSCSK